MSLLKEIQNKANLLENVETFEILSPVEIQMLVDMVIEYANQSQSTSLDDIEEYIYTLIADVPGLEDSGNAHTAANVILNKYIETK